MTPTPRPPQSKDGVGRPGSPATPSAASHRKKEARRRIFRELVHIAAEQGASIELGVSTADALQQCLDRAVALFRFAADMVDQLHVDSDPNASALEDGFFEVIPNPQGPDVIEPNRWYKMEREARLEIEKLAAMMTQLGIAERVVRVREAEAQIFIGHVREAAITAGISHDQVRLLGQALRDRVAGGDQMRMPSRGTVTVGKEVTRVMRDAEVVID